MKRWLEESPVKNALMRWGGRDLIVGFGFKDRAQQEPQPFEEASEVVAGGGEHGVSAVAVAAFEIIAIHAVLGLDVADDGFDGGASLHLAFDGGGGIADPAGDPDLESVGMIVAAIALVDMDALGRDTNKLFHVGDDRAERVAIERIAVQSFDVEHELAALG